jgi:HPt (histidine-containing phosphotransfer) domain-containing protein
LRRNCRAGAHPFNLRELISSVRSYLELAAAAADEAGPLPDVEIRDRFREDAVLLRELREPFESGAAPDGLRHVAHKLVGVAGIYGFAAISAAAAAVERALKHAVHDPASRPDVVSRLDDLLDLLDQNSGLRPD